MRGTGSALHFLCVNVYPILANMINAMVNATFRSSNADAVNLTALKSYASLASQGTILSICFALHVSVEYSPTVHAMLILGACMIILFFLSRLFYIPCHPSVRHYVASKVCHHATYAVPFLNDERLPAGRYVLTRITANLPSSFDLTNALVRVYVESDGEGVCVAIRVEPGPLMVLLGLTAGGFVKNKYAFSDFSFIDDPMFPVWVCRANGKLSTLVRESDYFKLNGH